jgi:hypothetical protein
MTRTGIVAARPPTATFTAGEPLAHGKGIALARLPRRYAPSSLVKPVNPARSSSVLSSDLAMDFM